MRLRLLPAAVAALLVAAALASPAPAVAEAPTRTSAAVTTSSSTAARTTQRGDDTARRGARPLSRPVAYTVRNTNESSVACRGDGRTYRLRGRLVGPRRVVAGRGGSFRLNVLVHDAGTGAWFWNLRRSPGVDYATQLARRGETSLVLDRLGYGASRLRNGSATCLGAQVSMLHQVVQDSYAGLYHFTDAAGRDPLATVPHATSVVVHGHGTGAAIAQIEAAGYDDTAGLVLLSPISTSPTGLALDVVRGQAMSCARSSRTFAPYGSTTQYRRLLFSSASGRVRREALGLREATPCGDVSSLAAGLISLRLLSSTVDVPVLVLHGSEDARSGRGQVDSSRGVTRRTIRGAGNALPLERQAGTVRSQVERWLRSLDRRR